MNVSIIEVGNPLRALGKVYAGMLEARLKKQIEIFTYKTQYGFRKETEKAVNTRKKVFLCFINLEKTFDRIKTEKLWKTKVVTSTRRAYIMYKKSICESYVRLRTERNL